MKGPVWENPELWEACSRHGAILSKHEKITQLAILDLYDEMLYLFKRTNGNAQQQVQADPTDSLT